MDEIPVYFESFGLEDLNDFILVFFGAGVDLECDFGVEFDVVRGDEAIGIVDHPAQLRSNFQQTHQLDFGEPPDDIGLLPVDPFFVEH